MPLARRTARASATSARLPSTFTSLESSGSRPQAGSPTIAARCTTASAPSSALRAGVGVADVAADDLDALALELGGDVLLAVQQRVEHLHLAAGGQQLVDDAWRRRSRRRR